MQIIQQRLITLFLAVLPLFYCGGCSKSEVSPPPRLIFFVTIDTLRADHLKNYGYLRDTAPFIDSLGKDGATFLKAFSAAPHTAPSHASIFTGLYPFQHNLLRNHEILNPKLINLRSLLERQGYTVGGIPAVGFLDGKVGFDKEEFSELEKTGEKKFWYRNAKDVVDRGIAWLSKQNSKDKVFLWLHFYDVHQWAGKGNLPKEYWNTFEDDDGIVDFVAKNHLTPISFFKGAEGVRAAMNGYDRRVKFVDDQLLRLNQWVKSSDLGSDVLWVITSDHGEGLGNHDYEGHGEFLYQEQLHVPLLFSRSAGRIPARRLNQLVRTVDLMPTLLELAGGQPAQIPHPVTGISIVPLIKTGAWGDSKVEYSFAERRPKDKLSFRRFWEEGEIVSLHNELGKYIEHSEGIDQYFDLEKDPFELKNLAPSGTKLEIELSQKVNKLFTRGSGTGEEPEFKPEELEELKSLGYL